MRLIVECQQCHSRFRLDEARVPATGAKVRCSQCKTAFIVKRPGTTPSDIVDEVVAEATAPGHANAPAPTEDMFERLGAHFDEPASEPPATEDHWEFDEAPEPPAAGQDPPRVEPSEPRRRPERAASTDSEEDLDSLGSPAEWDLLTGAAQRIAQEASFQPEPAPAPKRQAAPAAPMHAPAPASVSVEEAVAHTAAASAALAAPAPETGHWRESLASAAQAAIRGAAWIGVSALCAAGLALALAPTAIPEAEAGARAFAAPAGVTDLTVARIESAVAGQLAVVRGEIAAGAARTRVRVSWVDEAGKPLATAIAGAPLAEADLRELRLERIHAEHEQRGTALVRGGKFEAAYAELPEGAAGIAVTRERVPEPPAPPPPLTSSDPSALPSAE